MELGPSILMGDFSEPLGTNEEFVVWLGRHDGGTVTVGPGLAVGPCVGNADTVGPGVTLGVIERPLEGFDDGNTEALDNRVGKADADGLGLVLGTKLGFLVDVGLSVGANVGVAVGASVGVDVGLDVGLATRVGKVLGAID